MVNIEFLRKKSYFVYQNLKNRGFDFNFRYFKFLDDNIKLLKTDIYQLQHKHKLMSELVNVLRVNSMRFDYLILDISILKRKISLKIFELNKLELECKDYLLSLPNLLHDSVPYGNNDGDNLELRRFSTNLITNKNFKNDIEDNSSYIDFNSSAYISKSGFVLLKDDIAQLYRALGNYMIDLHVMKHGYMEVYSPLMVNEKSLISTGHLPKFSEDLFSISGTNLWMIPTSEVVLSNLASTFKFDESDLPLKFVSKTPCFRKEKGSYGYKVRGLIRQHQFDKVELVKFTTPHTSYIELEELVFHAETVLQNLNLSYRVISLCSKDIGFSSAKTYDLEVWFPKRKMYVEVSSCSNTESFQSMRMKASYSNMSCKKEFPHILNGSGLAIGRIFLAIIENYSDSFGNLVVPDVLVQYMHGKNIILFN